MVEEMCQIIKDKQPDVVLLDLDYAENGWIDGYGPVSIMTKLSASIRILS